MNLLRATVSETPGWWEIRLLDLDVAADGPTEEAMLRELEHMLTAEYHLAVSRGRAPFIELLRGQPVAREDGDTRFRRLNLPKCVSMALSLAFRSPTLSDFHVAKAA